MKRLATLLIAVLTAGLLAACGTSFDASGYIQALLDNSYKNDSTGFVEMKIGTAEEAAKLYEEGLDSEVKALLATADISEEQIEDYRQVFADILASAKYTVGEAKKQDDGSYVVAITYEQMKIFEPAVEEYYTVIGEILDEWTAAALAGEEVASEEEMMEMIMLELKTCLDNALAGVTYGEPETTTITIELVDGVYTPKEEDIYSLELKLFDTEAMQ